MSLLLANLAATGMLIGLIWTIQLVHYPLFAAVGREAWPAYAAAHGRRVTVIVLPWMVLELVTTVALLRWRPVLLSAPEAWLSAALVALLWLSTALVQGPTFTRLSAGWDPALHRRLVRTNWVRTAAWTLRGVLLLIVAARAFRPPV